MSSHVWSPRFVYRNLVDAAASITATDEVTGMEDDFLQSYQPQEVWRADTLGSLNILVTSDTAELWDTVWLGYTNATPKRNVLVQSNDIDTTWTTTNASVANNSNIIAPLTENCHKVTASGAGSVEHGIEQTWTPTLTTQANQEYTAAFYVSVVLGGNPDGVQFAMNAGANAVSVQLDLSAFTLGSITYGTGWSAGTATVETVTIDGTASYRVVLTATQATAITTLECEIRMVMGGSVTFTQAGEDFLIAQCYMGHGSLSDLELPTTTERCAGLRLQTSSDVQKFWPIPSRALVERRTDRGWIHAAAYAGAVQSNSTWRLYISDEANLDSYFEAGRLVIGKAWHPQAALAAGSSQSHAGYMARVTRNFDAGRSSFEVDLGFLTEDSVRELWDMFIYCNPKGASGQPVEAEGGQLYRPGARPVLFLADDAAGAYEPERIIYGYLTRKPIVSEENGLFRASVEIEELVP